MARYDLALPPERVVAGFTRLLQRSVDQIIANIHESRTLAAVRDILLPKLISGEVSIGKPRDHLQSVRVSGA